MPDLVRLSVSLEQPLFEQLESLVEQAGYENRSEYVRDLIRAKLVDDAWQDDAEVLATVHLVYDHHAHGTAAKLTKIQHDHDAHVLATTHIHLDHHLCAEMIMVRGAASEVNALANHLRKLKGVLHADVAMTSTAVDVA